MANQILAGAVFQAGQVIAGVDANNPPYVGPPVESLVSLYLNGTTSGISDASENSHSLTTHGDVSVLPTSPYNTSGAVGNYLSFPTSSDYLNVPQNDAFNFDGGDFTVEFFMNLDGTNHGPHPNNPVIIGGRYGWYIQLKNNDSRITFYDNLAEHHADVTIDIDSWNHVAVTREGDTIRTFLNGVEVYSGSTNRDAQLSGSNLFIGIGARLDSHLGFNGSLSDIRIVKGTALYTSGFTVPTSALTEVSGTSLLLSGDSLTDESSYGHTVNVTGNVTSNTGTPRSTTRHSMTFDGNGDYISVADHDEFDFGTEDFTVEMWMNADTQSANFPSLFSSSDYNSTGSSSFRFDNVGYDGKLFLYTNGLGDPALSTTNTLSLNAWNHIALVRNGTSLSFYVNGSEDGTITISDSQTFDFSVGEFRTGRGFDVDGGNAYFNGEIADLRAVKGKAVYSSNFSTPTLPVGDYSVLVPAFAHWAETLYGVYSGGGSAGGGYSTTSLLFNVPENDNTGISIMDDIDTKLTDNEVFKIEFRNSNKVVHSTVSPHRITMNPNPPYDDPDFNEGYYNGWRLNLLSEGDNIGNQLDPSVTLYQSGVSSQDTTVPSPTLSPENDGSINAAYSQWVAGNFAGFDQVIFYGQSGDLVDHINLSSTRTGNGFDADGTEANVQSALIDVVNPSFPTFERVLFRSRAQAAQNYAVSISMLDPVTMVSTPLPDPTGIIEGAFGYEMVHSPDGSLLAIANANDYNGQSGAENITEWGAVYIYDTKNLSAGPTHTIRHHQDEGISGRGRSLGSSMLMTDTHLYVGVSNWYAGPYISDWQQRNAVTEGRVFKYDLSDLSAAPVAIESPKLPASNIDKDGNPSPVNFGDRMYAMGDKIFVVAMGDLTNQTVLNNRQGKGGLYVYDANNFATGQHTDYLTQNGWYGFGYSMYNDGDDLWILSPQPQHGMDHYTFDYGQLWKYSLSDLSAAPTLTVNPQDFRGSDGGSNWDRFGQKVVFTDTKVIISSAHEYEDWPSDSAYKGYIYIMNKDGSQKQTLTNLPPNHREEWTVFGRYMQLVAGKLLISRYSPYGQDTAPNGAYPDGNGELWIYDPENLGAAPVLWDEAGTINANEEVIDSEMVVMNLQV